MRIQFASVLGMLAIFGAGALSHAGESQSAGSRELLRKDPQRFEKSIAAFEEQDKTAPPPEGAIVCIGSSSMRRWHETIHEDLAPLTVIARGFGGSTMNDALYYAERIVIAYKPRAVLLYEGDNDTSNGIGPQEIRDTFEAFVAKIHEALPQTRIYALSIKPSIKRLAIWPDMQEANRLLAETCGGDARLTYINVASIMLNEDGQPKPDIFTSDDLHMNEKGYQLWTQVVRPVLLAGEAESESSP